MTDLNRLREEWRRLVGSHLTTYVASTPTHIVQTADALIAAQDKRIEEEIAHRESESRWAKQYMERAEQAEAALAGAESLAHQWQLVADDQREAREQAEAAPELQPGWLTRDLGLEVIDLGDGKVQWKRPSEITRLTRRAEQAESDARGWADSFKQAEESIVDLQAENERLRCCGNCTCREDEGWCLTRVDGVGFHTQTELSQTELSDACYFTPSRWTRREEP